MPQKPVFYKAPILTTAHCFPSNGTVRTTDERLRNLYVRADEKKDNPFLWEGLFRVACLIKNKPLDEPVTEMILNAIRDTENGSIEGKLSVQISIARAAFAVYEYNTDRSILQRIAVWCRYLEIEFDQLTRQDTLPLYQPADLMEFLVRFYQVTGVKAVLRICTRIRAAAFNWTSALHTFQQSIPVQNDNQKGSAPDLSVLPDEIDYDDREKLINHAEMLADGVRYSVYSGLFSGNGQDLAAGKTVWRYLHKHHYALCGGTTSNPYLCGRASDQPICNRAVAAWTEAFASQMNLDDSEWALDEMIRIVFNALDDCLNRSVICEMQKVNTVEKTNPEMTESDILLARLTRAAAAAYLHTVSLTENGICINYLLPGKIMVMVRKQPVLVDIDSNRVVFRSKKPFSAMVDVFMPVTGTSGVSLTGTKDDHTMAEYNHQQNAGYYVHLKKEWQNEEGIRYDNTDEVLCENTHHQGLCIIYNNRLYSIPVHDDNMFYAVKSEPEMKDGELSVMVCDTAVLRTGERSADIPVLPSAGDREIRMILTPYSKTLQRITMLPRVYNHV